MLVLKFGGTSVANAENIRKTVQVVRKRATAAPSLVVVSALSGVTDQLIQLGTHAAGGNVAFRTQLQSLETQHLDTAKALIPAASQSATLSLVKQHFIELEAILEGVFVLGELSPRTKDRVMSFGELLSSRIISAFMLSEGLPHEWVDARKVIATNSSFGQAQVDEAETRRRIQHAVSGNLHLAPGFIGADAQGNTTTLGRGGSDYTAAIFASALDATALEIWTDVSGMMTAG